MPATAPPPHQLTASLAALWLLTAAGAAAAGEQLQIDEELLLELESLQGEALPAPDGQLGEPLGEQLDAAAPGPPGDKRGGTGSGGECPAPCAIPND